MIVFNQTTTERDILHRLLADLGLRPSVCRALGNRPRLVHYHSRVQDRWATLVRVGVEPAPCALGVLDSDAVESGA